MQLVAYGAQDVYLTGNPQITFFKVVYRRHTNFAMESIEQVFNGTADFNRKVTCTISRNGDLIHRTYLQILLPGVTVPLDSAFRWLGYVGQTIIKTVELEIGGMRIDKHYGDWLHIWNELTQTAGKQLGYGNMVGNIPSLTNPQVNSSLSGSTGSIYVKPQTLYVPLEFWFCRNPGLALPLIALQYHEVKINIEFAPVTDCYWSAQIPKGSDPNQDPPANDKSKPQGLIFDPFSSSLWVDYIYLDTDERRRFAQVSHEYLIEQLQFTGQETFPAGSTSMKLKLNFNHPTKELIWVVLSDANTSDSLMYGKQWYNYTDATDMTYNKFIPPTSAYIDNEGFNAITGGSAGGGANSVYTNGTFEGGDNPVATALLQLNGHDRFTVREGRYFNLVQPYQHHENIPSKGIYVYSFGLKPEEHQPSGTCNFSRIDVATLNLTFSDAIKGNSGKINVYAVNYNVLRIMSGMGGLAYSN
ncbi:MAG: hypothetical protein WDW38_006534 [Sanguina aurantia]